MSDTFVSPQVIQWELSTANLTASAAYKWIYPHAIPFNYELIGLYVDVATGPTLAALEFDVLYAAAGTTYASITTSIFGGTNLPSIAYHATTGTVFNTGALAAPTASGPVNALLEGPITDPGSTADWGTGEQPYVLGGTAGALQGGPFGELSTPNIGDSWESPSGTSAAPADFWGNAGDLFVLKIAQTDYSSGAGGATNGVASLWYTKR